MKYSEFKEKLLSYPNASIELGYNGRYFYVAPTEDDKIGISIHRRSVMVDIQFKLSVPQDLQIGQEINAILYGVKETFEKTLTIFDRVSCEQLYIDIGYIQILFFKHLKANRILNNIVDDEEQVNKIFQILDAFTNKKELEEFVGMTKDMIMQELKLKGLLNEI